MICTLCTKKHYNFLVNEDTDPFQIVEGRKKTRSLPTWPKLRNDIHGNSSHDDGKTILRMNYDDFDRRKCSGQHDQDYSGFSIMPPFPSLHKTYTGISRVRCVLYRGSEVEENGRREFTYSARMI